MSHDLDSLLAAPLGEPRDEGFSEKVMLRVFEARLRRERRDILLLCGAVSALCAALPFTTVGQSINHAALQMGNQLSLPFALAAGALIVIGVMARLMPE